MIFCCWYCFLIQQAVEKTHLLCYATPRCFPAEAVSQISEGYFPVRAYDAFADAVACNALGIAINPNKVGNTEYDPKTMLKLLV